MKRKMFILFLFSTAFFITESCEESFTPYGKFATKYSLNFIVRSDTSLQVATVFKSYPLNNNSNVENRNKSFVHNAFIRLWNGKDVVYFLRDSTMVDTSSGMTLSYYYTNEYKPQPGDNLQVEALLPDGNRLKSSTKLPGKITTDSRRSSGIIPSKNGKTVTFAWKPDLNTNPFEENQVFIPTLYLVYKQKIGQNEVLKKINIPWKYQVKNGSEVGINKPPNVTPQINYSMKNFAKVLKSISKGDKNKENYTILSAVLYIKVLDKNLSEYYLSSKRIFDNFSIRLDVQDFSNITNGFGIFGSVIEQKIALVFDKTYISTFGYQSPL